jgi:phospholipid/cholesterol/gamma-HCH transport system substrate-binding protein
VLSAIALVVVAGLLLDGGGSRYEVRALVESAGQLVKGNLVKVGGVTVGTVHAIDLTSDNQAQITLRISDPRFKPLHEGTIATIRNTSLSSVAGRQLALQPGPNSNPAIRDGGAIRGENTRPIVDLDQLLNTLDAQARTSLQQLVHGGAVAFGSHPKQANAALAALNPALSQARQTTAELVHDQAAFERALVESAGVVSSVASRAGDQQAGVCLL